MRTCPNCETSVKGSWTVCPLCRQPLVMKAEEENEPSAFLENSLSFNRQKAIQVFFRVSLVLVLLYFVLNYFITFEFFGLNYVIFALLITWTLIVIFLRKRRNIAKVIIYILFFISLVNLYFDYVYGWQGWSITFAIPILSISALLAIFISIQVVHSKIEDYVLYLQLAALVGIVPLIFLIMDWVVHPLPSILSVAFSFILFVAVFIRYRKMMIRELKKRMHM